MKIAVIGAGAAGSLFGGSLSAAGYQVVMIDSDREKIRAIKEKGIEITFPSDNFKTITSRPDAGTAEQAENADYILFCVKAYSTLKAAEEVSSSGDAVKNSIAVTLQNGAGNIENLMRCFERKNVAGGTTSEGAVLESPGVVRHGGRGETYLSMVDNNENQKKRMVPLLEALNRAGFASYYHDNIYRLIWRKLSVNASINPLTALTGKPNSAVAESQYLKFLSEIITSECAIAAASQGIIFDQADLNRHVMEISEKTSQNLSSMLQDIRAGRKTEIDYISGAVEKALPAGISKNSISGIIRLLVKALEN